MRTLSGVCGDREGVSLQRPGLAPRLSSSSLCLDTLCVMTTGAVLMNMDLSQSAWVQMPTLPFTRCVTLGKLLDVSVLNVPS